ncbi:radical SAM (seleno)protein TrsS [Pleomorphomonas oryzae]|uniref:radical SAM (seleno)protein TrsS n=1 Tax=Pleomorphomonas oryzae TaxID=261934 RepID=UPI000424B31E|nr:radical SAM (seleno)protein TrsS [Pleomorphomonas oryzae]
MTGPVRLSFGRTRSVCPECLTTIPAERFAVGDTVYLDKTCPTHGRVVTPVWRGLRSYEMWSRSPRATALPVSAAADIAEGCPRDCGLCADHRQQSCCVLIEVTSRCDLVCPVCFASAGRHGVDTPIGDIGLALDKLRDGSGQVHIQLSGGEPTVRDDLPEIVALVRAKGFDFVQLNTNGLRIGREPDYLAALVDAGLDCVFLQFDGVSDAVYKQLRGRNLLAEKRLAIASARAAGVGVVLVPTLVPGVNTGEIGAIVDFAKAEMPTVRAVHFQPVSYFGRNLRAPRDQDRITLPEVIEALIDHADGAIRLEDFRPGSAENPFCSFSGRFAVDRAGRFRSDPEPQSSCCGSPEVEAAVGEGGCCGTTARRSPEVVRAQRYVAGQWATTPEQQAPVAGLEAFDAFLEQQSHRLSLSGMAFQDAWTLDLDRLRQCHIHVAQSDGRVVPFCAYNLTDIGGRSLYREPST